MSSCVASALIDLLIGSSGSKKVSLSWIMVPEWAPSCCSCWDVCRCTELTFSSGSTPAPSVGATAHRRTSWTQMQLPPAYAVSGWMWTKQRWVVSPFLMMFVLHVDIRVGLYHYLLPEAGRRNKKRGEGVIRRSRDERMLNSINNSLLFTWSPRLPFLTFCHIYLLFFFLSAVKTSFDV